MRFWIRVAGGGEAALRSLSALAGTAAVGAAIVLARRMMDRGTALAAGLVLTLSPLAIYYAQEARAYALLTLLILVAADRLWVAVETDRARDWAWAALALAAMLYTHFLSIFTLPALAALPLVVGRRERAARAAASAAAAALLFLPWAAWALADPGRGNTGIAWVRVIWQQTPPALALPRSLEIFAFGSHAGLVPLWLKQFAALDFPPLLRATGLAALGLAAAVLWMSRRSEPEPRRRAFAWLALLVALPLAVLWLVSLVRPLYAAGRYDLIGFPAFPLLVAAALTGARRTAPALAGLLALGLALPTAAKLYLYYAVSPERPAAETAEVLDRRLRPGDGILITGVRALPVFHALGQRGYSWREGYLTNTSGGRTYSRMFPRATERAPAALDASRAVLSEDLVRTEVDDQLAAVSATGTLWVLFETGNVERGRMRVPEQDAQLVRELERRGWRRRPEEALAGLVILPFRRD